MTDYQLWTLSKEAFQDLVYNICTKILGVGTIKFTIGPDGGKDAKFVGKANSFPSISKPWNGKFIIQAKGCSMPTSSCSDTDFLRDIDKEIIKVKKMIENKELENYMIFTNRKLSGKAEGKLTKYIRGKTKLKNVWVGGREYINTFLNANSDIVKKSNIEKFASPLRVTPQDMKELIEGFNRCRTQIGQKITEEIDKKEFIKKQLKNKLNKLGKEYFEYMKQDSLPYFNKIDIFLKDPKNKLLKEIYLNISDEIKSKFTIRRDDYDKFEEIFEVLYNLIVDACPELSLNRRLINVFLHYMYWNCNIGRTK